VSRTPEQLRELVQNLAALPTETEWVEFKQNYADLDGVGQYISALSNSAALQGKDRAYMVWGITDDHHAVVGTSFKPSSEKKGSEDFIAWATRLIDPKIYFEFHEFVIEDKRLVLLEVAPAEHRPIAFSGTEYIRIGSYKKKLREFADHERRLWQVFARTDFESGVAALDLIADDVFRLLPLGQACTRRSD
jgi:ATP-dependent DNA helicase RecG